jgi:hypothetical protein
MGGQETWKDHGSDINAFVVMPEIVRALYYAAMRKTLFGKMNLGRSVKTTAIIHNGNTLQIDAGNDSPVWEKQLNENNMARFTMREENKGMATYGDGDVQVGDFAQYLHLECHARRTDTPAYPIVGFESADNIKRVINDLVSVEKENISTWIAKEMDFDAFRALFMGASRGLLDTKHGGKGIKLYGANTAGTPRVCFNTFVPTSNTNADLRQVAQDVDAVTHNAALADALTDLPTGDAAYFKYSTHRDISALVDDIQLLPVKIGGREYRAVVITDMRNVYRLREDQDMSNRWAQAAPRAEDNLVLFSRDSLILDHILYLPTHQMKHFRPIVSGATAGSRTIQWGAGMDKDPRTYSPAGNPDITASIVLGAGALIRGRRRGEIRFSQEVGRHGKGAEYAANYDDGWMRREWGAHDGRSKMFNDSSFIVFNRDAGGVGR